MTARLEVERLTKYFPIGGANLLARWRRRGPAGDAHEAPQPGLLHALDDVSFTVSPGESVGLVGESGCGKSTLARLIARLIDPTSGKIQSQGRDLGAMPAHHFAQSPERRLIQQVFQDATESLNPRFTAAQAISESSTVGLFQTGLKVTAPLTSIPERYGKWSLYAGFRYYHIVNDGIADGNRLLPPGSTNRDPVQAIGGVALAF
jgi:peptide/nickel transport system ATP-binding protein